jgi:cell division protein FtsZ
MTMAEVGRVMEQISRHCERAQIIMGAAVDETLKTRLSVTIIAAKQTVAMPAPESPAGAPFPAMDSDLAEPTAARGSGRSASRCFPAAGSLTPEQREQVLARRGRKGAAKMRQAQLPLAIISKGRFDKSEPTIHKGEDLDIPTYIRRGVALN